MKRYERYKPSGIEWIGEIPEHWKVKKLKYVGFAHAPSLGIQKYANLSRLLLPEDIEKFKENTSL